jgi:hypothetical protein
MASGPELARKYVQEQIRLGLRTDKTNWKRFRRAVRALYKHVGIETSFVPIYKVKSPVVAAQVMALLYDMGHNPCEDYESPTSNRRASIQGQVTTLTVADLELKRQALDKAIKIAAKGRHYGEKLKSGDHKLPGEMAVEISNYKAYPYNTGNLVASIDDALDDRLVLDWDRGVAFPAPMLVMDAVAWGGPHLHVSLRNELVGSMCNWHEHKRSYFRNQYAYLTDVEQEVSYCLLTRQYILAVNRPETITVDDHNRLHNNDKPAVRFRDGWSVYAIHGVRVPRRYVETPADKISPLELLIHEDNTQVRMAVISKVGFLRLMSHLQSTVIDIKGRDQLLEVDVGGRRLRLLHLHWKEADGEHGTMLPVPATRGEFANVGPFIPHNINDFEEVRWWTFRLRPSEIKIMGES